MRVTGFREPRFHIKSRTTGQLPYIEAFRSCHGSLARSVTHLKMPNSSEYDTDRWTERLQIQHSSPRMGRLRSMYPLHRRCTCDFTERETLGTRWTILAMIIPWLIGGPDHDRDGPLAHGWLSCSDKIVKLAAKMPFNVTFGYSLHVQDTTYEEFVCVGNVIVSRLRTVEMTSVVSWRPILHGRRTNSNAAELRSGAFSHCRINRPLPSLNAGNHFCRNTIVIPANAPNQTSLRLGDCSLDEDRFRGMGSAITIGVLPNHADRRRTGTTRRRSSFQTVTASTFRMRPRLGLLNK